MTRSDSSRAQAPWYIVMEAWHPHPHFGLDGLPWPLDDSGAVSGKLDEVMVDLPIRPGGAMFRVCCDADVALDYFTVASERIERVYLIEVGTLATGLLAVDGYDVGRPNGGFSVIGQDICKADDGHRRFGRLLNRWGLFPDEESMRSYLDARGGRVAQEGLEYLDESIPVQVRVLRRTGGEDR